MKRLYLIRHAKSSWADAGRPDFDRPLNGRGKRDALLIGKRLAAAGVQPDLLISSPARRARKTARAIAEEIGYRERDLVLIDALYTFSREGLVSVLRDVDDEIKALVVVGHNDAISDAAEWLSGAALGSIPTCGVVSITFATDRWRELDSGSGVLEFFEYPKRIADADRQG
ncbi:phosphohistidine phosphatase SixA [Desulfofustis limnaeus]|uniref:Phosphohistidine phosphatase SixA n=2 Tax=Desulfofustis limnaeus TaxID=2740163 RepID=A0ABN6M6K0_9BACT|nr:phosphohistidine phosphatase SixA [Desulfofustis limnaeus]